MSTEIFANTHQFARLLRSHRDRTRLSQEQLAERAQLGVRTLRDIERGRTRYPRPDSVRRLAAALALTGDERTTFESFSARPLRSSVMPANGRWDLPAVSRRVNLADVSPLRDVEDVMATAVATDTPVVVGVTGPAGVGKTTFAAQGALLCRTRSTLRPVFVDLRREGRDVAAIGDDLRAVRDRLGTGLLIVDNAERAEDVRTLLAVGFAGAIVTSPRPVPGLVVARQVRLSF